MGRRKYAIVERLDGRVVVVTGGSSGIGKATAHQLAAAGAHVFIFARSEEKTRPIIQDIIAATKNDKVEFVQVDLCSLDGVKAAAAKFLERGLPLHTLVCNAGSGKSVGVTKDGFEHLFAQNYLSHFLLTMLLLPRLRETQAALPPGSVRIVNVSSSVCISAPKINFDDLKVASQVPTYKISAGPYARSKLAQVLCAKRLAKELEGTGINVYSLNPGVVATDIMRDLPSAVVFMLKLMMMPEEKGALTTLYCATSPDAAGQSGLYYDDCAVADSPPLVNDEEQVSGLWTKSLEFIKEWYTPKAKN